MRLPTPSFLHARSRSVPPGVSEITLRPAEPPPPNAADDRSDNRDKAFYLVVLEVTPPERPQS